MLGRAFGSKNALDSRINPISYPYFPGLFDISRCTDGSSLPYESLQLLKLVSSQSALLTVTAGPEKRPRE